LKAGPRGVEALAAGAGVEPDALQRLLKAASSKGVFREAAPRVWANNRVSALLRADHPSSMRPMVRHWGGESYAPHHHVLEAIKMGSPHANAFEAWSGGEPLWKWYDRPENAAVNSNFNAAMAGFSKIVDAAIVADLDWPARFGASATVADVGGGVGAALAALLRAHPGFRGALLDRPSAVAEARRVWAAPSHAALAPRAELRAGDFFKAADVPAADVFFLRFIIHDHADADALIILRALRETAAARMKETGQAAVHLVVCDMVLPDAGPPAPFQAAVDLQMLAMLSARERTAAEFKELLAAGGWAVEDVVRIRAPVGLVVARAA
jgi:C-methyltransferase